MDYKNELLSKSISYICKVAIYRMWNGNQLQCKVIRSARSCVHFSFMHVENSEQKRIWICDPFEIVEQNVRMIFITRVGLYFFLIINILVNFASVNSISIDINFIVFSILRMGLYL